MSRLGVQYLYVYGNPIKINYARTLKCAYIANNSKTKRLSIVNGVDLRLMIYIISADSKRVRATVS